MKTDQTGTPKSRKPLRLWPGVAVVTVQWLLWFVAPAVAPDATVSGIAVPVIGILAGLAGGLLVLVWWLLFSRAPWLERLGAIALMVPAVFLTYPVVDQSISNGMMGRLLPVFLVAPLSLALVASAAIGRRLPAAQRRAAIVVAILLACASMTLVRTGGISGEGQSDIHWRWSDTPEERLLAHADDRSVSAPAPPQTSPAAPAAERTQPDAGATATGGASAPSVSPASAPAPATRADARPAGTADARPADRDGSVAPEWPGFRGPLRDGVARAVRIQEDWERSRPSELWRRAVGPGWSSFAVAGDLVYTQEQRGEHEVVSCYRLSTGEPVWLHRDAARFYESNAGAGPRATPTLSNGRVYTVGATGLVNALDARTGARLWSRDAAREAGREVPEWGFSGSPLVVGDLVVVALDGQLAAYDARTGESRWTGPQGGGGYSSPHLITIDGVPQVVILRGRRTTSVSPADGRMLWEHSWEAGVSVLQPGVTDDGELLITSGDGMGGVGTRRLAVTHTSGAWNVEERWTSRGLKPYFNDFVVHEGHAYGFDGSILSCIDVRDGQRKWKGGRYGHGQMVLLPDQDLLLVLSEDGEIALVRATPDQFTEVARFKAIDGKTWNHPVVVRDLVIVRNDQEMAAFRLPLAGR